MTRRTPRSVAALFVFVLAILLHAAPATASEAERQAVLQANTAFYSAWTALMTGDIEPMQQLWSRADDVTSMGADGRFQVGWDDVRDDWEQQATVLSAGEARATEVYVVLGEGVAAVHGIALGYGQLASEDAPREFRLRVTNLFRQEDGAWKMIGHHADPLPFFDK